MLKRLMVEATSRNHALDGLRGYAALIVALGHSVLVVTGLALYNTTITGFAHLPAEQIAARLLYELFPQDAAVSVFFVLSEYVLYESFARGERTISDFPDYVLARIFRLMPLVVVTGILAGIATPAASAIELVKTMTLLSNGLNGPLWSLQVEMIASLLLFAVWLAARRSTAVLVLSLVASIFAGHSPFFPGVNWLFFFPAFCLGALVGRVPAAVWNHRLVLIGGVVLLTLPALVLGRSSTLVRYTDMLGAFALIGSLGTVKPRFATGGLAQVLGALSYPFYLSHTPCIMIAARFVTVDPARPLVSIACIAAASIALALTWSCVVRVLIELPAMNGRPRFHLKPRKARQMPTIEQGAVEVLDRMH